jgi:hypothetical protein
MTATQHAGTASFRRVEACNIHWCVSVRAT